MPHAHDDLTIGYVLGRREVLALLATSTGAAVVACSLPPSHLIPRCLFGATPATAAEPCIVRPEQTEGPYFVDERLNRSDIRSDPSDGSVKAGTRLALAFAVQRIEGSSCVPLAGALVDLWHCDAAGIYSDVQDPSFDTTGKKFLRGYQLTDANGVASFVTIYPGWYQGRTVHMHFKIRTDPDATTGFEFTSQLYFDDTLTDTVHAEQPYAAKGQRTLRNSGDGIYQGGGSELLLTPSTDGTGGYTVTFAIALAGTSCATIADCLASLESVLPDPASAASRRVRRASRRLRKKTATLERILDRAPAANPERQARLYGRARTKLDVLRTFGEKADAKGTLDVPLASLTAAISVLLGQLPA